MDDKLAILDCKVLCPRESLAEIRLRKKLVNTLKSGTIQMEGKMKNTLDNRWMSVIVLLVVGLSCFGIVNYLRSKPIPKPEDSTTAAVSQDPPGFDPDEQDTEDMIYVGTFPLIPASEFVPPPPYAPENLDDTPFFVFDDYAGVPNAVRGQSYGTQDKIGIERDVWAVAANRVADFEFIRDQSAARDAFALQHTGIARSISRHWRVSVFKLVGNELMLLTTRGCDDNVDGLGHEDAIGERWQLNPIGTNPTLIERSYDTRMLDL